MLQNEKLEDWSIEGSMCTNGWWGYGGTASERFETGVHDLTGGIIHFDLELHHISTSWSSH